MFLSSCLSSPSPPAAPFSQSTSRVLHGQNCHFLSLCLSLHHVAAGVVTHPCYRRRTVTCSHLPPNFYNRLLPSVPLNRSVRASFVAAATAACACSSCSVRHRRPCGSGDFVGGLEDPGRGGLGEGGLARRHALAQPVERVGADQGRERVSPLAALGAGLPVLDGLVRRRGRLVCRR